MCISTSMYKNTSIRIPDMCISTNIHIDTSIRIRISIGNSTVIQQAQRTLLFT